MKTANISIRNAGKKELHEFEVEAWKASFEELYGEFQVWAEEEFRFKAVIDGEIVGGTKGKLEVGVVYGDTIIIKKDYRGKGIGKKLIQKMERWAKKKGAHKIYFFTRMEWESREIYEYLGYEKWAELPKHFLGYDFVGYHKFI